LHKFPFGKSLQVFSSQKLVIPFHVGISHLLLLVAHVRVAHLIISIRRLGVFFVLEAQTLQIWVVVRVVIVYIEIKVHIHVYRVALVLTHHIWVSIGIAIRMPRVVHVTAVADIHRVLVIVHHHVIVRVVVGVIFVSVATARIFWTWAHVLWRWTHVLWRWTRCRAIMAMWALWGLPWVVVHSDLVLRTRRAVPALVSRIFLVLVSILLPAASTPRAWVEISAAARPTAWPTTRPAAMLEPMLIPPTAAARLEFIVMITTAALNWPAIALRRALLEIAGPS
jgi:hypothetical protein